METIPRLVARGLFLAAMLPAGLAVEKKRKEKYVDWTLDSDSAMPYILQFSSLRIYGYLQGLCMH
jgi:hypothetical protein